MLDLRRLNHFSTTAKARSFVRAAELLGISQPGLSRSIQALEREYGVELFHRRRNALTPTSAGRALLERAEHLLSEAGAIDQHLRRLRQAEVGKVSLGLGPLPATMLLPELLSQVLTQRPGIEIRAQVLAGPEVLRRTIEGEFEFCCCAEALVPPAHKIDARPLITLPLARMVRALHPLMRGEGDAEDFPLIGGSGSAGSDGYHPQIVCDDFDILRRVTLSSDAIWITAPQSVRRELAHGELAQLPRHDASPALEARLILFRPRNRNLSAAGLFVVNLLRRLAAEL